MLVVGAVASSCAEPATHPPGKAVRHVVLISLDTLRADHLGCYGSEEVRTPFIDALAGEAALLTRCTTPVPSTLAAHASLLTGTYPHTHGTPRNGHFIAEDNLLLTEVLAEAGYLTAGFVGAYPLKADTGFDQGFEIFDDGGGAWERSGERLNRRIERWLEGHDGSPTFLFVHYWDAHYPFTPPPPFDRMYAADEEPVRGTMEDIERTRRLLRRGEDALAESSRLRAAYAGCVSHVDSLVGELLELLRASGLHDEALIILTSDHGEAMDEHDEYWDHGESTYEGAVHVPLLVRHPEAHGAGRRLDLPTSSVDVVPTVLELLDLAPPEEVEGTSFAAVLGGGDLDEPELAGRPPVYTEASKPHAPAYEAGEAWPNRRKSRAILAGEWKLVHRPVEERSELYHLASDPAEQVDRIAEDPELAAALLEALDAWGGGGSGRAARRDVSEETARALRALGYAEGED